MHKIKLTEAGMAIAVADKARGHDELEMYPEDSPLPGRAGKWTVSDDVLVLLLANEVFASSLAFDDQLAAITAAVGPVHGRNDVRQAFSTLCDLQLVEYEAMPNDHVRMLAEFFAVLGNTDRLLMVFSMIHNVRTMTELKHLIGREASSVYHHIRKLTDVGLVFSLGHGEGYTVNANVMATCLQALVVAIREGGDNESEGD